MTTTRMDRSAERLVREHFSDVHRWVRHVLGPDPDLEDVVQEVLIVAYRKWPSYRGDAKVTTWLYGIVRNVVRNHRRKTKLRKIFFAGDTHHVDRVRSSELPTDEAIERRQRERMVYEVLDGLRDADRTVLILFEIEGLSGEAIAERLDVQRSTVFVRLHRARRRFLERMKKLEARS